MLSEMKWLRSAVAALVVVALLLGVTWAKKPTPPPDPEPEPDPPPVVLPDITYVEIPLGNLGYPISVAGGMNDFGDVVGYSYLPTATGQRGDRRAFLWTTGSGMIDLNTGVDPDAGWVLYYARDINNNGQVVGNGYLNGKQRAFRLTLPGTVEDLGTFGGSTYAYAINDNGDVTGYSVDANGVARAYLFTDEDGMIDLGGLAPDQSYYGYALNSFGMVSGRAYVEGRRTLYSYAYRYMPWDGMVSLGALEDGKIYFRSSAADINDFGDVVGESYPGRAFRYTDTAGMEDLGTLGGESSAADAIDNSGMVVGTAQTADGDWHPFILIPGYNMANLDDLMLDGPLNHQGPLGLNEVGEICGTRFIGVDENGTDIKEAFVLMPLEP